MSPQTVTVLGLIVVPAVFFVIALVRSSSPKERVHWAGRWVVVTGRLVGTRSVMQAFVHPR